MFEQPIVTSDSLDGTSIVGIPILVDDGDFEGVHIAAHSLAEDFAKVTEQHDNVVVTGLHPKTKRCIIIGSLSRSKPIRSLKKSGKIDTSRIDGKWESWMTSWVSQPFEGCDAALVIAGSDMRGAIYGTYSLSEQIGVSPWYWWADVPPKRTLEIYGLPLCTFNGEPSVKYRGIFINDESPAMDSWVHEKFGPKFDSRLYSKVFELLLRLKANFMWPGMWRGYPNPGRSFFVDDPKNQETADRYGIVVGTSHHEPMQRAMNEWSTTEPPGTWDWQRNKGKITKYFEEGAARAQPYNSFFTMGMRGEGDGPVSGNDPVGTLTEVLQTQRRIIKDNFGSECGVPQLMALYKEVQGYYEDGLEIPDDVTLLFSDDNFGSLRRLPTDKERKRKGGVGIYYHFEYTGAPRSYRWMNSNTLGKVWHQLQLAHHNGANQIWIFNVGDIKPMELPMNFAFQLAWDINSIRANSFQNYFAALAAREFSERLATSIGKAWYEFDRLLGLRKHEHIDPDTFMLLKHHEARNLVRRWEGLWDRMEYLSTRIPIAEQPAFFELVLHPIKASWIYVTLRVAQYTNQLFAKQRRNTTNVLFHECIRLFESDHRLSEEYHTMLGGKWNHIMRQPHYGYSPGFFMAPSRDMISGLCYVQTGADSNPSVGQMGIAVEGSEGVNPGLINEDSDKTHPSRGSQRRGVTLPLISRYGDSSRQFEIFHRGTKAFSWVARPQYDWIRLTQREGELRPDDHDVVVNVFIEWEEVPKNFDSETYIEITGSEDGYDKVHLRVVNRSRHPSGFEGFLEGDGYVSIEAAVIPDGFIARDETLRKCKSPYVRIPALGRTQAGAITLPNDLDFSAADELPFLCYRFHTWTDREDANLELQFNMTLETDPMSRMKYDLRWDGGDVQTHRLTEDPTNSGGLPNNWSAAVQNCVWKKNHNVGRVRPGVHTIDIRFRNANMCLEKMVLDLGGLQYSYLGPPPSRRLRDCEVEGESSGGMSDFEMVDLDHLQIDLEV